MKRCKPHRKYIAFCNLNIYIFFITICFQIFKTTFYLKLFCMRDIFYCMIWIAFFFSQQNRLFKFAKQKFLHRKLTYLHVFIYNSKKKTLTTTKKKTIKKPQKQPLWESKHLNKPLIMQLVIPPLLPYDFKGTVLEIENFRTTVL